MCLQEKGARVPTDDFNCESQQGRACGRESRGNEFAPGLVRHRAPIVKRQAMGLGRPATEGGLPSLCDRSVLPPQIDFFFLNLSAKLSTDLSEQVGVPTRAGSKAQWRSRFSVTKRCRCAMISEGHLQLLLLSTGP